MRSTRIALAVGVGTFLVPIPDGTAPETDDRLLAGAVTRPAVSAERSAVGPPAPERPAEPPVAGPPLTHSAPISRIAGLRTDELTRAERALVTWARARFELVGLDLPAVDVTFHADRTPCRGHAGRFRGLGERRRIAICVSDRGTPASHLQRQRTLVHELAHAWDHANLDDADRDDLLDVLEVTGWFAPEADWADRGVERLAETIVWGLYDQRRRPILIDLPCGDVHADFVTITGVPAPGPIERICEPPLRVTPSRPGVAR